MSTSAHAAAASQRHAKHVASRTASADAHTEAKAAGAAPGPEPQDRQERIRVVAYGLYESRGCEPGHALEDWLNAEALLDGTAVVVPSH